jgi:nicotinamide mononucleotide transporter
MEFLAVLLTLISVVLTIKSKILCWPIGILGIILYGVIFLNQHLYWQAALQVVFVFQSIHGWYFWNKNRDIRLLPMEIKKMLLHLMIVWFLTVSLLFIFTDKTDNPQLLLDILTTLLSLLATWYLAKRNIYNWIVWIIADVFMVVMFLRQGMYWSMWLYILLTFLAFKGLKQWKKDLKTV